MINQPLIFYFFLGTSYYCLKTRITWLFKFIVYDFWEILQNGLNVPIEVENGLVIPKPSQEWKELDKKKTQLNTMAIYYLHCAIDRNKYNHVCQCESPKDI